MLRPILSADAAYFATGMRRYANSGAGAVVKQTSILGNVFRDPYLCLLRLAHLPQTGLL
jgi:hypothetical protein